MPTCPYVRLYPAPENWTIEPITGVCPVFTPAAFAFRIQALALPRQVTDLFWAIYQVQLPPTNPRDLPVYLTV